MKLSIVAVVSLAVGLPTSAWAWQDAPAGETLPNGEETLVREPTEQQFDVTERKVRALSREVKQLQQVTKYLEQLGDPTIRQPGEEAGDYLQRVDRVLKARATVVTIAGQQMKNIFVAKVELETQLAEYEAWAKSVEKYLEEIPQRRRARRDQLQQQFTDLQPDVAVLANLIYEELPAEDKSPEPTQEAQDMQSYFDAMRDGRPILESIADRSQREAKYQSLSLDEKREQFEVLMQKLVDADYELQLLEDFAIAEIDGFRDVLPEAHREVIAEATALLRSAEMKSIDDRASQLSILAQYTLENLALVQKQGGPVERLKKINELKQSLPQMEKSLEAVVQGKVSFSDRADLMSRTFPAATTNTTAP